MVYNTIAKFTIAKLDYQKGPQSISSSICGHRIEKGFIETAF